MMLMRAASIGLLLLASIGARVVSAQLPVRATAKVIPLLAVDPRHDLLFEDVRPGLPMEVDPRSGHAASWRVRGANGSDVLLVFSLPRGLTGGVADLVIDGWAGCHASASSPTGCTPFEPSSTGTVLRLRRGEAHQGRWVFVGATVRPAAAQPSGEYRGTITLTALDVGS